MADRRSRVQRLRSLTAARQARLSDLRGFTMHGLPIGRTHDAVLLGGGCSTRGCTVSWWVEPARDALVFMHGDEERPFALHDRPVTDEAVAEDVIAWLRERHDG